jgi:hypothetical protein
VSRFWLVEMDEDLATKGTTRTGVWSGIHGVNGVISITDLEAISSETLDELLRMSDCKRVFNRMGGWHWEHSTECIHGAVGSKRRK